MSKFLVIVESPGKIKKIQSYLGSDYKIVASYGHVVDLPKNKIGVDIKKDFKTTFVIMDDKKDVVNSLIKESKKSDIIYIMSDGDREGAGIANNIYNLIKDETKGDIKRAKAFAITKTDVTGAIENSYDINIDYDLVNAYECRRILDRIVGFKTSFLVTQATGGKSAGRVQSATLRILADREQEIQDFIPQTYFDINAELVTGKFEKILAGIKVPDKLDITTEKQAIEICDNFKKGPVKVSSFQKNQYFAKPYAPFTTSSLLQSASSFLGMNSGSAMKAAQELYEQGACFVPGEQIVDSNGSIVSIDNFNGYNVKTLDKLEEKIDNQKFNIVSSNVVRKFELPYNDDIISLRTLCGQEISATKDHQFLSYKNGKISMENAENLSTSHFVFLAKQIPVKRIKECRIIDILSMLPDDVKKNIRLTLKSKELVNKITKQNRNNNISKYTYYKYRCINRVPLKWYLSYVENKKNDKDIENMIWAKGGSKPEKYNPKGLLYFIGLCLGDGHITKSSKIVFPKCITSINGWEKIKRNLGDITNTGFGSSNISFSGKILHEICTFLGGYKGNKCKKIYIHEYISALKNDYLLYFLAGLIDSDGSITYGKGRLQVSYTTKSQIFSKQLNVLFRTLGYMSGIHRDKRDVDNCSVKLLRKDASDFIKLVYPYLITRKNQCKHAVKLVKKYNNITNSKNDNFPIIDIVDNIRKSRGITKQNLSKKVWGNSNTYWNYSRIRKNHTRASYICPDSLSKIAKVLKSSLLSKIANGDVYISKINSISKNKFDGKVYCLETTASNFIVNNFIVHNCTYHRTDSSYVVTDFINLTRSYIDSNFGDKYLPANVISYQNKKNSQEAHEAIRPTDISVTSAGGTPASKKLYELIWKRMVSSQMTDAAYWKSSAEFKCGKYILSASGSECTFDGWRKVWGYSSIKDEYLPELKVGEEVKVIEIKYEECQTKPPNRYSEASTIKRIEQLGIGRPSTYKTIFQTLENRKYIEEKSKSIHVTELGMRVSKFLVGSDFCFVDLQFTSSMEENLDKIASKESDKKNVLSEFWNRLKSDIDNAKDVKKKLNETNYKCEKCGANLVQKHSKFGPFFGCSKYPECKQIYKVGDDGKPVEGEKKKDTIYSDKFDCPKCGAKMAVRKSKYGEFLGCSKYPKCSTMLTMDGEEIKAKKKTFKKFKKYKKSKDNE